MGRLTSGFVLFCGGLMLEHKRRVHGPDNNTAKVVRKDSEDLSKLWKTLISCLVDAPLLVDSFHFVQKTIESMKYG
ncbi:unnamed protein product [Gongylonema pulchrum]|uniref:DDE_Tnp_ISL3 domain-containing protein n=1 Tax=Gongylonema pulchrum TaxID=637853 RepID=A0A183E3G5_9BILA|nr:unnamed protein product [Gongylonema pulchrum]